VSLRNEPAARAARRGRRSARAETRAVAGKRKRSGGIRECIAYVATNRSGSGWLPCGKPALPRTRFCRRHADAINGAVLGMTLQGILDPPPLRS